MAWLFYLPRYECGPSQEATAGEWTCHTVSQWSKWCCREGSCLFELAKWLCCACIIFSSSRAINSACALDQSLMSVRPALAWPLRCASYKIIILSISYPSLWVEIVRTCFRKRRTSKVIIISSWNIIIIKWFYEIMSAQHRHVADYLNFYQSRVAASPWKLIHQACVYT